jgi:hypothetical protein
MSVPLKARRNGWRANPSNFMPHGQPGRIGADPRPSYEQQRVCLTHVAMNGRRPGETIELAGVLDGGYFDNAGAETLRGMTRAIRNLDGGGEKDLDPAKRPLLPRTSVKAWVSERIASGSCPTTSPRRFSTSYNGMGAHEAHLARDEARRPDGHCRSGPLRLAPDWRLIRRTRPLSGKRDAAERPNDHLRSANGLYAIRRSQAPHREFRDRDEAPATPGPMPRRSRRWWGGWGVN